MSSHGPRYYIASPVSDTPRRPSDAELAAENQAELEADDPGVDACQPASDVLYGYESLTAGHEYTVDLGGC